MSPEERRFLRLQMVGALAVNLFINAGLAALAFRGATALFAKGPCVAFDTLGTSLLLPLVTCVVLTPIVRHMRRRGLAPSLRWTTATRRAFGWLPRGTFLRGLVLGLLGAVLAAPATLGLMHALGVEVMSRWAIIAFKGAYGAVLGVIVTPPTLFPAIGEE